MSGPRVRRAVSSAGVAVPVPGTEAMGVSDGSSEYPLTAGECEDVLDTERECGVGRAWEAILGTGGIACGERARMAASMSID